MSATLTPALTAVLRQVNRQDNNRISFQENVHFQRIPPGQLGIGDCKTYADTKASDLTAAGFPEDSLYMAECWVPPPAATSPDDRNHAWLEVDTDQGTYCLSNGFDEPLPLQQLDDMGWVNKIRFRRSDGLPEPIQ